VPVTVSAPVPVTVLVSVPVTVPVSVPVRVQVRVPLAMPVPVSAPVTVTVSVPVTVVVSVPVSVLVPLRVPYPIIFSSKAHPLSRVAGFTIFVHVCMPYYINTYSHTLSMYALVRVCLRSRSRSLCYSHKTICRNSVLKPYPLPLLAQWFY
jgi:hypothetical protein